MQLWLKCSAVIAIIVAFLVKLFAYVQKLGTVLANWISFGYKRARIKTERSSHRSMCVPGKVFFQVLLSDDKPLLVVIR